MPEENSAIEAFYDQVTNVSDFIWGGSWNGAPVLPFPPMVIALFGVGLWIMIGLRFYPLTHLGAAFIGLFKSEKEADAEGDGKKGEISPFAALSTALSGQVGTGNIAGVATAITFTNGTQRTLTEAQLKAVMALAFAEGAKPSQAYLSATHKQQASAFTGIADIRVDASGRKPATIMATPTSMCRTSAPWR